MVGSFRVLSTRGPGTVLASGPRGSSALLAFGPIDALDLEAAALESGANASALPRLLERGEHEKYGAWLAFPAPLANEKPLTEAARDLDVTRLLAAFDAWLDIAILLERSGFQWAPDPSDIVLGEAPRLVRARVLALKSGTRVDGGALISALAKAILPEPACRASTAFVHLLVAPKPGLSLDHARAEVSAARSLQVRAKSDASRAAAETDVGMHKAVNEDACACEHGEYQGEPWTVLIVCDGVSTSTHAEQASKLAADTACQALSHFARSGDVAVEAGTSAVAAAIRAAHVAICAAQIEHGTAEPPGTTIVAALLYRHRLTVGWVGDSRAYWVTAAGADLLTHDHSWINESVDRGDMTQAEAEKNPLAHAITRCLGPLEVGDDANEKIPMVEADVRSRDLAGSGLVLLCSDGLWNYFPDKTALAELTRAAGSDATPRAIARYLVNRALFAGGGDNVSVGVIRS